MNAKNLNATVSKITEIYVAIASHNGVDEMITGLSDGIWVPFICTMCTKSTQLPQLKANVQKFALQENLLIKIVKYTYHEEIETIDGRH